MRLGHVGVAALVVVGALCAPGSGVATRSLALESPSARVGMNYFDGWSGPLDNFHFNGLVRPGANGKFPGREPLSGWSDASPAASASTSNGAEPQV